MMPTEDTLRAALHTVPDPELVESIVDLGLVKSIAIGDGRVPIRASLVKCTAALFSIGSGGSIGREGPMVQLAAMLASLVGRWGSSRPRSCG